MVPPRPAAIAGQKPVPARCKRLRNRAIQAFPETVGGFSRYCRLHPAAAALEGASRREAVVVPTGASRRWTIEAGAPAAPRVRQAPVAARRSEVASARNRKWEGGARRAEVR